MLKNMKIRSSLLLGFGITILISIIIISATLILMNTQRATYSRIINSEIEACTVIKNSRLHANIAARNLRNILLLPNSPDRAQMQSPPTRITFPCRPLSRNPWGNWSRT